MSVPLVIYGTIVVLCAFPYLEIAFGWERPQPRGVYFLLSAPAVFLMGPYKLYSQPEFYFLMLPYFAWLFWPVMGVAHLVRGVRRRTRTILLLLMSLHCGLFVLLLFGAISFFAARS